MVNLLASELPWLTQSVLLLITITTYIFAVKINRLKGSLLWLHPIVLSSIAMLAILTLFEHSIEAYAQEVGLLTWLLGPATCALAIPIFRHLRLIHQAGIKMILIICVGGLTGPLVTWLILYAATAPDWLQLSVLTKSITTPLAIDTSRLIGANPSLAAGIVILTGLLGVLVSEPIFRLFNIHDSSARGLALGTASHAIGTAHAISLGEKTTAFATVALCINGVATAILLPWIMSAFLPLSGT